MFKLPLTSLLALKTCPVCDGETSAVAASGNLKRSLIKKDLDKRSRNCLKKQTQIFSKRLIQPKHLSSGPYRVFARVNKAVPALHSSCLLQVFLLEAV